MSKKFYKNVNVNKIAKMSTQYGQISIQNSEEKPKTENGITKHEVLQVTIDNNIKTEDLNIAAKEKSKGANEKAPTIEVTDDKEVNKNVTIDSTDNAKSESNGIKLQELEKNDGVENGKLNVSNKVLQCFIISLVHKNII